MCSKIVTDVWHHIGQKDDSSSDNEVFTIQWSDGSSDKKLFTLSQSDDIAEADHDSNGNESSDRPSTDHELSNDSESIDIPMESSTNLVALRHEGRSSKYDTHCFICIYMIYAM